MDPLTRFNSVGRRAPSTAAQPQADLAGEARRGARSTSVTVRACPPPAPVGDDEDWDALIARAKRQASAVPPDLQVTPPPVPLRQPPTVAMGRLHAQRIRTVEEVRAKLDVIVWGTANRSAAQRPAPRARRAAEEDMVTPPPLRTDGGPARPRSRR